MSWARGLVVFLAVSFTLAFLIDYAIVLPDPLSPAARFGLLLRMFTPLAGVVVALRAMGYGVRRGLWELGVRVGRVGYILVALAVPYAAMVFAVPLSLVFGVRVLSPDELVAVMLEAMGVKGVELPGYAAIMLVAYMLVLNTLAGATINAVPALAEEVGWRGLLLIGLQERLGFTAAAIAVGIVWGLWHAPLVYVLGYNYPGYHGIVPLIVFIVFTVAVSLTYSMLRALSYSLLPPAIAHGILNANGGLLLLLFLGDRLVAPPAGVAHAVAYAIVAAILAVYAYRTGTPLYASRDFKPEQPAIY